MNDYIEIEYVSIAGYRFYPVEGIIGLYHFWGNQLLSKDQIETKVALARLRGEIR